VHFLNQQYDLFQGKKNHLSEGAVSKFYYNKNRKNILTPQNKEKYLL
jgi:hypothetical protein